MSAPIKKTAKKYDTVIIGGGFYGLRIAQFLREELGQKRVLVIEKESTVMSRASYNNQARVHNGYHYPRSVLTALRSRVNLPVFSSEYEEAIVQDFDKYYAVARDFSKVSARQFERFFDRIGAEIQPAKEAYSLFDSKLIEEVFLVKEYAFNTATLQKILLQKLEQLDVEIHTKEGVQRIAKQASGIRIETDTNTYEAAHVINTTYSSINIINKASDIAIVPLKHELTEMCLVEMPPELEGKAFTIMCGPFFSLMPFPARGLYTMSHVRYTPHTEWHDTDESVRNGHAYLNDIEKKTRFSQMYADIKRYMPAAQHITYSGESLWEVKTVLPKSEGDDSRPIMYLDHYGGVQNYICIMGGKIDNIYDVFRELKETYGKA
jgi:glycine/D-amino acid oxidase-like deaminating enzyme